MNPIAWLIGLALPACGLPAAEGLPTPPYLDVSTIVRPSSPNTALAAPEGFRPEPDIISPIYALPPDRLFKLARDIAISQPRTYEAASYPDQLQIHYVARSALLNFPDLITLQIRKVGLNDSDLILYSRSVYGHSDLGVNRKRIETWLAALRAKIPSSSER